MVIPCINIFQGDCRLLLQNLTTETVQCCVTSPPYWGLRDYGTAEWEGGDISCDHKRFNGYVSGLEGSKESTHNSKFEKLICAKCGARRIDSQLGLESTPEEYVANMVGVFRAVWRVLRDDATLWLNLGDSYTSGGRKEREPGESKLHPAYDGDRFKDGLRPGTPPGLKPKDLCGIPWRVAFALQADGWYLRSDIIWAKPNLMPESVTDRPTKAHEYLFLLTKQERYFYDADAIKEPYIIGSGGRQKAALKGLSAPRVSAANGSAQTGQGIDSTLYDDIGRNKRTVWTIATQPYTEAHFATFPEDLVKPCILAGSRPGDTILDPFAGSGTVGKVALELGRSAVLIELSPDYCEMARDRTHVTPGFIWTTYAS